MTHQKSDGIKGYSNLKLIAASIIGWIVLNGRLFQWECENSLLLNCYVCALCVESATNRVFGSKFRTLFCSMWNGRRVRTHTYSCARDSRATWVLAISIAGPFVHIFTRAQIQRITTSTFAQNIGDCKCIANYSLDIHAPTLHTLPRLHFKQGIFIRFL